MRKRIRLIPILAAAAQLLAMAAPAGPLLTNIYIFSPDAFASGTNPQATNSDGAGPNGLVLSGSTLFGTAAAGAPPVWEPSSGSTRTGVTSPTF
ncbi:MAG: hypothetical protein ACLQVY_04815 [Limisphaerales bacterium]